MRLYHTILILSALIISINAAFQAVWPHQFGQVLATVEDFGKNRLPTVRLAGELARRTGEFRRFELRHVIAESEAEMASLARAMSRQAGRIRQAGERLETLLRSPAEKSALADYLGQKQA